jgi:hypothetical protein
MVAGGDISLLFTLQGWPFLLEAYLTEGGAGIVILDPHHTHVRVRRRVACHHLSTQYISQSRSLSSDDGEKSKKDLVEGSVTPLLVTP